MEDTTDKLRRNLVAFASLYLAGAFLNLSPSNVSPWLPETLKNVDPLRLQILFICILIYLAFRWFTSKEQLKQFYGLKELWINSMLDFSRAFAKRRFDTFEAESLGAAFAEWEANQRSADHLVEREFKSIGTVGWMRVIKVSGKYSASMGPGRLLHEYPFNYPIRQTLCRWSAAHLYCFYVALRSEHFWEWVAPLILFLAALFAMVERLATLVL